MASTKIVRGLRTRAASKEVIQVAKNSHPKKREVLKEYKRLFIAQLQQEDGATYEGLVAYRDEILNDPELGINAKTLDRAELDALMDRKKQLQHQSS